MNSPVFFRSLAIVSILMLPNIGNCKTFTYSEGEQKFEGQYFAAKKKTAPGIVLVHNWMGVSAETEKQALRFQKLGYHVLVADIYGAGQRPKDMKEAAAFSGKYKADRKLLRHRVHLAIEELKKLPGVQKDKLAITGYCFGGTSAIEAARAGEDIRGIVSFHGGLDSPTPADGANIKAKVLALHGAIDPYVPVKDVAAFEDEMQKHNVDYELVKYGGVVHSFTDFAAGTDISKGAAYNAAADERSFLRAQDFLAEVLR